MRSLLLTITVALVSIQAARGGGPSAELPRAELTELRQLLPRSVTFDTWFEDFGVLPPDFAALPASPYPQDLLSATRDGQRRVISAGEWPQRRLELRQLVEEYLLGHAPPAPGNVRAEIEQKEQIAGRETWTVRLEFGPNHAAHMHYAASGTMPRGSLKPRSLLENSSIR